MVRGLAWTEAAIRDLEAREIFVHRYRLIYQVAEKSVLILALIHGWRDFARAWKEPRG